MKTLKLLILSLFISFNLLGQKSKIDSLKDVLKKTLLEKDRLLALEGLNKSLMRSGKIKESIPYFIEMAELANKSNNHYVESRGYNYISEAYMKKMDSVNAILFAKKAINLTDNKNDLKNYLISINQLGRVYYHFRSFQNSIDTYNLGIKKFNENKDDSLLFVLAQIYSNSTWSYDGLGKTKESIDAIFKGIEIAEKTNSNDQKAYGFYVLGAKYKDLNAFENAEKYYLKSLQFSDSVSLKTYANMNHHGLGILYSRWGKYDKAMYHNNKALTFYKEQGDKIYVFDVLHNIAVVYQRKSVSDSVFKYGLKALKIAEDLNHKLAINGTKITLSKEYLKSKNYNDAEKFAIEAIKDTLFPSIIDINSKAQLFENLSKIYEYKKLYSKSLDFYKKFKLLSDSIQKSNLDSKFAEIETKYQSEQKEKELAKQKIITQEQELLTQKANSQKKVIFLFLIVALLLLIFFVMYTRNRKKRILYNSRLELVKARLNEQENIGLELHDNIAKKLETISIKIKREGHDKISDQIINIKNEIRKLSKDLSLISFEESSFEEQVITTASNYQSEKFDIKINGLNSINWNEIESPIKYNLLLIIREAISNSYNHSKSKNIFLEINKNKNEIILKIMDDGIGFDIEKINFGRGFRNMKIRTKDINGEIDIQSIIDKGTQINIKFVIE